MYLIKCAQKHQPQRLRERFITLQGVGKKEEDGGDESMGPIALLCLTGICLSRNLH